MSFFAGLFTLRTLALCLGLLAVFLLRRYYPRRPAWLLALATLLVLGALSAFLPGPAEEPISQEERNARLVQQQLVADWHKRYQRTIDTLDHTWKQYHLVLADFNEENIDLEDAHLRLLRLQKQSSDTCDALIAAEPPAGLQADNYALVLAVIQKTRAYANAQRHTIQLTAAAADPEQQFSELPGEQSRTLQEIMIRESPAGLFTANEISALRNNVAVPD